ncbi:hypothetical protein KY290_034280 [Solanum tuberosum]|uniref:Uncharacterized protein n=1 Tax=Solanum tuberosum TaxID=4113 RepID=A0ABQ7U2T0_SOLTU|nr:hypothetical protein KY290_034280 [Solanum tuberosum]
MDISPFLRPGSSNRDDTGPTSGSAKSTPDPPDKETQNPITEHAKTLYLNAFNGAQSPFFKSNYHNHQI